MKPDIALSSIRFLAVMFMVSLGEAIIAQEKPPLGTIAVLRMKNIEATSENTDVLKPFAMKLNAALATTKLFDVPAEEAIAEALDDEGVDPDDLIDLGEYLKVGKSLKMNFIVIGSVSHKAMTLYARARVYSVTDGLLRAVVGSDIGADRLSELVELMAHRIGKTMEHPIPVDTMYHAFEWIQDFRFAFGRDRLDLAPPVVHFVNQNPPFEIAVKINMDRLGGGYVVTNFDIYADNEPIANIDPEMRPPLVLRERELVINGHRFCFQADVKELRTSSRNAFASALINISARYCK
jgi:hypothetical protein